MKEYKLCLGIISFLLVLATPSMGMDKVTESIVTEESGSDSSLQQEFNLLKSSYYGTIRCTEGCGERGQLHVDDAYRILQEFVIRHPEFKKQLPRKIVISDDGFDGVSSGIAAGAREADCVVQ